MNQYRATVMRVRDMGILFLLLTTHGFAQGAGGSAVVVTADGGRHPANWPEVVAGELPFGHERFRPSPDRPLGYRGCMNGWFPGAKPPLRFSDGTPVEVEMDVEESYGNVIRRKVLTVADDHARNIRFRTPLPGWSLAQPLPVLGADGQLRVFVKCHPWWVVCIDGVTGKVLWQDPLSPFHARGMPADKAEQSAEVLTIVWACGTAIPPYFGGNNSGVGNKAACPFRADAADTYAKVEKALTAMQERMGALDPTLAPLIEPLIEAVRADRVKDRWNSAYADLERAFTRAYNVHTKVWFHGYTGLEMPTATSDGERVYVTFGQGQVGCYRMDGTRVWAREMRPAKPEASMYFASPTVFGGRLFFYEGPRQTSGLVAVDASTGKDLWRVQANADAKGNYTMVRPARLGKPGGGTIDAVIGRLAEGYALLAVGTGAQLGPPLPYAMFYEAGPYLVDGIMISNTSKDGSPAQGWGRRLSVDGQGKVTWEELFQLGKSAAYDPGTEPVAVSPQAIVERRGGLGDPRTGARWAGLPRVSGRGPAVIAGQYAIFPEFGAGVEYARVGRADGSRSAAFHIYDIADPRAPKLVSKDNVLVIRTPPADLVYDRHLAPHGLSIRPLYGTDRSVFAHFGCANGGVYPHGKALYVQSATHLYGIAEP